MSEKCCGRNRYICEVTKVQDGRQVKGEEKMECRGRDSHKEGQYVKSQRHGVRERIKAKDGKWTKTEK